MSNISELDTLIDFDLNINKCNLLLFNLFLLFIFVSLCLAISVAKDFFLRGSCCCATLVLS